MLGIIGGSGLYGLVKGKERGIRTKFGTATVVLGKVSNKSCAFIPRHGRKHSIPPHRINHWANISAFREIGVTEIFSIASVGIISDYELGDLVLVRDFVSFGPQPTFFDDFSEGLSHADMTEPYGPELSKAVAEVARSLGIRIKDGGILAHTSGPRFETKTEIKALGKMGANLVGMTSVPEAILANELEIKFANLAIAGNYACGISKNPLTVEEVLNSARKKENEIKKVIEGVAKKI